MLSSNVLSQVFIVKCYSKSLLLRMAEIRGEIYPFRFGSLLRYLCKAKNAREE